MNENQTKESNMPLPSMDDMKIVSYDGNRTVKIACETPEVIELGGISERHSYYGQDL